jgi:hypothetical protein
MIVEQYRVTGKPSPIETVTGPIEFPGYDFVWDDRIALHHGYPDARTAALDFRDRVGVKWSVPPTVTHRTITYTEWEEVQ